MSTSTQPSSLSQSNLNTLCKLLPHLWPRRAMTLRLRVVITVVLLLLAKLVNISVPYLYKRSLDSLTMTTEYRYGFLSLPIILIGVYGVARLLASIFNELKDIVFAPVTQQALQQLSLQTFTQLHRLSLRFHLERKTGGLSRIIEKGVQGIESVLRFSLFNILPTSIEIILVIFVLWFIYGWLLSAVTMITLMIYIVFTLRYSQSREYFVRARNTADINANARAIDSLINYETVKYFNNERHETQRYADALVDYQQAVLQNTRTLSVLNIGQNLIISIGLVAVMMIVAHGIQHNTMTLGDFILVNAYLIQLYIPLNILGFAYREIKLGLVNMEHMFNLLHEPQDIIDHPQALSHTITRGAIEFHNVFFAYNQTRPLLANLSLTVPAGQTLAIVGTSGAGKSTIARLLYRFYDVTAGHITIDGYDIRRLTQHTLRAAIGVVPQDTVLFNDTLLYNIAYGCPAATPQAIEDAARQAHIHDFIISLPQQYQTLVGERGLKLSGGEKQRIAIARTLIKNPVIFLFDEATSALDTKTERDIQASLLEISVGRTTVIIAHRLSTVTHADTIIVLDHGQIIEQGTHQQLLQQRSMYARLWQQQQKTQGVTGIDH